MFLSEMKNFEHYLESRLYANKMRLCKITRNRKQLAVGQESERLAPFVIWHHLESQNMSFKRTLCTLPFNFDVFLLFSYLEYTLIENDSLMTESIKVKVQRSTPAPKDSWNLTQNILADKE